METREKFLQNIQDREKDFKELKQAEESVKNYPSDCEESTSEEFQDLSNISENTKAFFHNVELLLSKMRKCLMDVTKGTEIKIKSEKVKVKKNSSQGSALWDQKDVFPHFGELVGGFTFSFQHVPLKSTSVESSGWKYEDEDTQYYKPVVPLPDLVEISSGEENEQVVFSHRAKLYRYDKELQQWKERGVGELKILQNNESRRARLVMRREQVLKLCANHWITTNMKLEPMKAAEKAWTWSAFDFADGDGSAETLAVRFRLRETADAFKKSFEEAVISSFNGAERDASADDGGGGEYNDGRSHRSHVSNPSSVTCFMCDAAGRTRDYQTALRDIYRTLSDRPRSRPDSAEDEPSDEDDSPDETNVFCTETDVTLPSNLARSSSSSVLNGRGKDDADESRSGAAAVHVYQEMLHIYEKLQQYQQEKSELEAALKQKTKENKRMKASFDSIKELNDSMKKQRGCPLSSELHVCLILSVMMSNHSSFVQLNEVSEQNRKLECQSRKVQARLENLQRKYESFTTHRSRETSVPKASDPKPCKPERPQSNKAAGKAVAHGPSLKLLALLLDWLVDGQLMEVRDGTNLSVPRPSPHERCARVLPMLVEQLHGAAAASSAVTESSSSSVLLLSVLRCIYCCLLRLERSSQHAVLTSTLRRLGEEVSRGSSPLFKSSCLHTRFLCSLIIIKTISQVDVLAQAVDVVSGAVRTDQGQALFLEYRALPAVLALLRSGSPGLLAPSVDVLLQMSSQSRTLSSFLDECSTEDFFRCASLFLRHPRVEPPLLEKMLMLLQKLSSVRKNKRLFEASSLHLLLQEMHRTSDRSQTFISMNLSSILLNLGMLTRS
ncbi:coiled-coil domain-containing protein 138 [Labeo rohita]|uniref:Coiled-coil domain-containing protein 138 n=1 Tax=Labeo rohita TaxID=84645 RepID=A0A498MDR0_LABRO|nr:coiled-coil domain-containing protein 138 [Labeo rohita]